jgi:chromatin remodeling complex protein RSC6
MSSKQKTTKTATPAVAEPVVVKVEAPVIVEKKVAAKKTKKTEEVLAVAPVVLAETAQTVVVEEVVSVVLAPAEPTLSEQSTDFFAKIQQLGAVISGLKSEYRALEKRWTRELKISAKNSNKKRKRAANRAPSGFVKPTKISDELASFLDKPTGSEMARTEVTRDINLYIRSNSLQDKANGRKINPDSKLAELLKIDAGEELTYFNLQKYMSRHFAKKTVVAAAATA